MEYFPHVIRLVSIKIFLKLFKPVKHRFKKLMITITGFRKMINIKSIRKFFLL